MWDVRVPSDAEEATATAQGASSISSASLPECLHQSEDAMSSRNEKTFKRSMSERAALALEKKLSRVDPNSAWARYFPNDFLEDENKVDDPRILANAQTLDSLGRVVTGA